MTAEIPAMSLIALSSVSFKLSSFPLARCQAPSETKPLAETVQVAKCPVGSKMRLTTRLIDTHREYLRVPKALLWRLHPKRGSRQ